AWKGTDAGLRADPTSLPGSAVGAGPDAHRTVTATRLAPVVLTVLALTWLNTHVYISTVLRLGTVASPPRAARWLFAAGAISASFAWCTGLGFGARFLGRWLSTPRAWRVLDAAIAAVMIALAISLVLPVLGG